MATASLPPPSFSFSLLNPTAVPVYPRPLPVPPSAPSTPTSSSSSAHAPRRPPPLSTPLEGEMEHSHDGAGAGGAEPEGTATTALVPTSAIDSNGEPIVCNACKLGLEETLDNTVVSFGKHLFHVDCRCAKCHNLVEHDTNLLLLSDGSPVCENCSYICSVCQKPIHNEAIVTGDESYHADCFRCRSCSNKIEELIFAKTTAGIWCMACHNERVARTRKHAEAKSSRSLRKDKEASRSSRSKGERGGREKEKERERRERSEQAMAAGQLSAGPATDSFATSSDSIRAPPRPLPPSPYGNGPPTSNSTMSLVDLASTTIPSSTKTSRRPPKPPAVELTASSSTTSLASLSRGAPSPLPSPPHSHERAPSQLSLLNERERGHSPAAMRRSDSDHRRGPDGRLLPDDRRASIDSQRSHRAPSVLSATVDAKPNGEGPKSPTFAAIETSSRQGSLSAPEAPGSRKGSLTAPPPVDKAANRRSGFYGAMAPRTSVDEGPAAEEGVRTSSAPQSVDEEDEEEEEQDEPTSTSRSFLPELHNSVSFYDPDTLLFLDQVAGSAPSSPKLEASRYSSELSQVPPEQIEHLSPDLGVGADSGEEEGGEGARGVGQRRPQKSEVARKVRESIQSSKAGGEEGGKGGLDVELVEMLLGELDGTKKEMKELQGKYNAFRRASRSAFEGFSMAREEYDKEVAARREAEARMDQLRTQFVEQAQRLAAVDKEQKNAETLKRQSKELRSSVVGMEKHLSILRAEVELSTAQAAELSAMESASAELRSNGDRSSAASSDLVLALNSRLEAVKDAHREEIKELVAQRDDLAREVAALQQTRDRCAEEAASLNLRNSALADQNADATRQLELLRETMNKLRLGASLQTRGNHHAHSSSSSSLLSSLPPVTTRSPLASASSASRNGSANPSSPQFSYTEVDPLPRSNKPEAAEPQSGKKFKWGKTKTTETPKANHTASSSSLNAKTPNVPRSGSTDSGTRTHAFQQTSILRPVRCDYCGDKMWGLNEVRCTICGSYSHAKCAGYLQGGCSTAGHGQAQDDTLTIISQSPVMFGNDLTAQVRAEGREVPLVVSKCIAAVEAYGMNYEGIYRKTGGMGQTKLITQFFERGQDFDLEDLDKFNDLAAITSCLKNFFRCLPVPLFTHELHEEFVSCSEMPEGEARLASLEQTLYKLPETHFFTARILLRHLHRIHLASNENKMTPANLGVVFGPTVLRSSVASREWSDMGAKAKIVEILVEHTPRLWSKPYPPPPDESTKLPSSSSATAPS